MSLISNFEFPTQCGARVLYIATTSPVASQVDKLKKSMKELSQRQTRNGKAAEKLLVCSLGPTQHEWKPFLRKLGWRNVANWNNVNYPRRLTRKGDNSNSLWVYGKGVKAK